MGNCKSHALWCTYFLDAEESCENCISTEVCRNNTGTYLRFLKLYDSTLSMIPCELRLSNKTVHSTITDEISVEISPDTNYSIQCPICDLHDHDIYYEIPHIILFNIPYCSITVTGMCL